MITNANRLIVLSFARTILDDKRLFFTLLSTGYSTSKWDIPETHLFRFQQNLEYIYILSRQVKVPNFRLLSQIVSEISWLKVWTTILLFRPLGGNLGNWWLCIFIHILSLVHWIFRKLGTFINLGVPNPKITLKSFSKQKVLKFWKKTFFPKIPYIYPTAHIISISHSCPSLTKPILCYNESYIPRCHYCQKSFWTYLCICN